MGPKRSRSRSRSRCGQSLYGVLGVEKGATEAQIRAAYRRLALLHHPDKNAGSAAAEERFKELNEAHAVLSDPARRRLYDRYGSEGLRVAADFGEENVGLYFALASPCGRAALLLCGLLTGCWCGCCCCCGCCCQCCCRCCGLWTPSPPPAPPPAPAPSLEDLEDEDLEDEDEQQLAARSPVDAQPQPQHQPPGYYIYVHYQDPDYPEEQRPEGSS